MSVCMPLLMTAIAALGANETAGYFGGEPPLDPKTERRHLFMPYTLAELHSLGTNYCENLLDFRGNITSYSHLNYDMDHLDAWHLRFPDDAARLLEGLAYEDQYSPLVRLELTRRIMKGQIAAHTPGTRGYHAFRHRNGGKTFLILAEDAPDGGRVNLQNWGDALEPKLKVGFRVRTDDRWRDSTDYPTIEDTPERGGAPGVARSARWWHESPYVLQRVYQADGLPDVTFTGRYWLSDDDMPLEYTFAAEDAEALDIELGAPGEPMALMWDPDAPAWIHLPDRETAYGSEDGEALTLDAVDFDYFILRKRATWASPGYSSALLVIFDERPSRIEADPAFGYGSIRLTYPGGKGGRVWLLPFQWLNEHDMAYVYRNAEHFLAHGRLLKRGYPTQQLLNAIPAGMAAGAYLLTKYDDAFAPTARIWAENAADAMLMPGADDQRLVRGFFEVRAAAWMARLGQALQDDQLVAKYTPYVHKHMARLLSPELGYDGEAWGDGWSHVYSMRACWLAWEATGDPAYREAYDRALPIYTIDENGIYRRGEPLPAPGGFDTYAGALPLAIWGHAGRLDDVAALIELDAPNGWHNGSVPVRLLWNDAGAGPWAQDDANPDYVGYCLRGLELPQYPKHVLPIGAFPLLHDDGVVEITHAPTIENPWFLTGTDPVRVLDSADDRLPTGDRASTTFNPGTDAEAKALIAAAGSVDAGSRRLSADDDALVYRFDVADAQGAALDMVLSGAGWLAEISPDGRLWIPRLDAWAATPTPQSLDLSPLTGSPDELMPVLRVAPPDDAARLVDDGGSAIERACYRYLAPNGSVVYRFELPNATAAHFEMLVGNGYRIEASPDGETWEPLASSDDQPMREDVNPTDAGWLRSVDATRQIGPGGELFLRISDTGQAEAYGGRTAFVRRITLYGRYDVDEVWVRLSCPTGRAGDALTLDKMTLRTWR